MVKTLHATFDGKVLRPEEPLSLEPNTRVLLTLDTEADGPRGTASFLRTALSLRLDGPPDWSSRLEDYLYGGDAPADA